MNLGRVIGNVWATQKDSSVEGKRMLLLQPLTFSQQPAGEPIVALDTVDSGMGSTVIFVTASEAAIPFLPGLTATDATIVGVIERIDHISGSWRTTEGGGSGITDQ